jgi:hypothetical protein
MLNVISWDTFLISVAWVVGAYYCISSILLYHVEIKQWIKGRGPDLNSGSTPAGTDSVMGGVGEETPIVLRSSTVLASAVTATSDMEPEDAVSEATEVTSTAPFSWQEIDKLLEDVRAVIQSIGESKCTREECTSLMATLLSRYAHLKTTSYRESVAFYVLQLTREALPYQLSLPEVLSWWDAE